MKLWVFGQPSGNPKDWDISGSGIQLVFAETAEQAMKIMGYRCGYYTPPEVKPEAGLVVDIAPTDYDSYTEGMLR